MRVEWLDTALNDLDAIARYYADINPWAALKISKAIVTKGHLLSTFPEVGVLSGIEQTRILHVTQYPYYILYDYDPAGVVRIMNVYRSSQASPYR